MSDPTIEQMLYELPSFIDDYNGRSFLHLQPWADRHGWNAFYGCVSRDGWAVHPVYSAEGDNALEALVRLHGLIEMGKFTLEPDPKGFQEIKRSGKIGGDATT